MPFSFKFCSLLDLNLCSLLSRDICPPVTCVAYQDGDRHNDCLTDFLWAGEISGEYVGHESLTFLSFTNWAQIHATWSNELSYIEHEVMVIDEWNNNRPFYPELMFTLKCPVMVGCIYFYS